MTTLLSKKTLLSAYRLFSTVMTPLALPAAAALMYFSKKYRAQMPYRLGKLPDLSAIRRRKPLIWTHALSVGEVNAVMPLIERMRKRWPDAGMLCTASTATGLDALKKRVQHAHIVTGSMPLDLFPVVSRVTSGIMPDCFVLCETDIWPGFIWSLKKKGIPALLVNGSISQKAAGRLAMLNRAGIDAAGLLYDGFQIIGMQSEDDVTRLRHAAGSGMPQVTCTGNMKFDISPPVPDRNTRKVLTRELGISEDEFVLVAGSTHEGEEKILIETFLNISAKREGRGKQSHACIRLVIAPRDPARASDVLETARKRGLAACLKSEGCSPGQRVVIVDTLGELAQIYALGHAAFVGGTMVPVGGHNLLEPAAHGIPVMWGPFTESCRDMAELLKNDRAGFEIKSREELEKKLIKMTGMDSEWKDMGRSAAQAVKRHGGAADRCLALVESALDKYGRHE